MATLSVPSVANPREDAIQLYRAFKGFGCDTATVIKILAHRDAAQRALIRNEYATMYSKDLMKSLASELRGDLETAVLLWMHDPRGRDAVIIKQALNGKTSLNGANEVLCCSPPAEIPSLKHHYFAQFGVHLEQDVEKYTSGDHKKLLLACLSAPPQEGQEVVDKELATKDAKALFKAGEKKLGTDEKTFIRIFSERSWDQLAANNSAYFDMYGNSLRKAVKRETSGMFLHALLTILGCADNPAKYYAKVLRKAMKGLGTDDTTLIRVIVRRTEIDMEHIKAEYLKKYKKTLNEAVRSETSGPYRTFLLSLLGSTPSN